VVKYSKPTWVKGISALLALLAILAARPAPADPPETPPADAAGTSITLHVTDAAPKDVYANLFRQAQGAFASSPEKLLDDPTLPKITLNVKDEPFWTVMQKLQKLDGLGVQSNRLGDYVLKTDAPMPDGPQLIAGPFMIIPGKPYGAWNRKAKRGDRFFVSVFHFYPEPKIDVLPGDPTITFRHAEDDAGHELKHKPDLDCATKPYNTDPLDVHIGLDFAPLKDDTATNLASIDATVSWKVALQRAHINLPDLLNAGAQKVNIGELPVTINFAHTMGFEYQLSISADGDSADALAKLFQAGTRVYVLENSDRPLSCQGQHQENNEAGSSMIWTWYQHMDGGKPYRLIVDVPLDIQTVDVPMRFDHLKLRLPD
jgi:hypothetical protein